MRGRKTAANCESCMNYEYDDDYECYVCTQDLDEDEMVRFVQGDFRECPYYQVGDEYRVVRKQMLESLFEKSAKDMWLSTQIRLRRRNPLKWL